MDRSPPAPHTDAPIAERHGATLTTARSALQVLTLLQRHPDGLCPEQVATTIGASVPDAKDLLRALHEEGFAVVDESTGRFRSAPRAGVGTPAPPVGPARELSLAALADELFARTHKRSYVGVLDGGAIEIVEVRGRQGLPRLPGMGDRISDAAHASAMGKVVLSLMRPVAVDRYMARGLRTVAPATITDPDVIRAQLAQAHRDGFATDVEELAADFCCVAAPVFDHEGGLRAVAGISMSRRAFEESLELLSRAVREVAGTKLTVPAPRRPSTAVELPGQDAAVRAAQGGGAGRMMRETSVS